MSHSAQISDPVSMPSQQTVAAPIDMDHLRHYTMGDQSLAHEVLNLFASQGRNYLDQLASATTEQERKVAAHTLKGSAMGVGAHAVAAKALCLENLAGSPDTQAWNTAVAALEAAFAEAGSFIAELA